MYKFGRKSLEQKATLHPDLQAILDDAIEIIDLTVIWGYRGEIEQNKAYNDGNSKLKFPFSAHNRMPSRAMDTGIHNPLLGGIDWTSPKHRETFMYMQGIIRGIAHKRGIRLKAIIPWDLAHTELED